MRQLLIPLEDLLIVLYEANRTYAAILEEYHDLPWIETTHECHESLTKGVTAVLTGSTPEQLHNQWWAEKIMQGWSYGPVKSTSKKTHPYARPWWDLTLPQQLKDTLFHAIVTAFSLEKNGE